MRVSGRFFELFSIITNDFIGEIVLLCCTHAHTVYTRARAVDAEDDKSLGDLKGENRKYFEKFITRRTAGGTWHLNMNYVNFRHMPRRNNVEPNQWQKNKRQLEMRKKYNNKR